MRTAGTHPARGIAPAAGPDHLGLRRPHPDAVALGRPLLLGGRLPGERHQVGGLGVQLHRSANPQAGILLLVLGVMALGIAAARSRVLPSWAGIGLAVGVVVFGVIGVILADVVQSIGAVLLVASALWLAHGAEC